MCELLAVSLSHPITAKVSIQTFALRDEDNADGWGLAWYVGSSLAVVKEPVPWRRSKYASFLEGYENVQSHLFMGHVRHATTGRELARANTHPFDREVFGRAYCFAHNGTVRDADRLALGRHHPIGETDSERIFCHLVEQIAVRGRHLDSEGDWRWLAAKLRAINEGGKLNCVLSDGRALMCYRDVNGFKGLTMRCVRIEDGKARQLEDRTVEILLRDRSPNRGTIIATYPLSEDHDGWHDLLPGELIVARGGRLEFSSERSAPDGEGRHVPGGIPARSRRSAAASP